MSALQEIEEGIRTVADATGPAVVGVGGRWGIGSGIVIEPGRVLTNAHNLRGREVHVTFASGRSEEARPSGVDVDGDLAVVEVDTKDAPAIEWGTNGTHVGAPLFALSNPGGRGLRVTFGFVSGTERSFRGPRGRRITGSLEHTAPLLPGSSGGPVVDSEGRLLGVNTNRLGEGFYLAIPADAALRKRVATLAGGQSAARPRLGVAVAPPEVARKLRRAVGLPEIDGLLVREVEPDGPAAAAGIRDGDLIVGAGDKDVGDVDDLFDALAETPGEIRLRVVRGLDERTVAIAPSPVE